MKITRIALSHHRLVLDPPFVAAWDGRPRAHFDSTIVRVDTDQGLVGIGGGGAMPGFAGHEELFIGRDPRDLARHHRVIETLSFHYGRCWPLEVALWDLCGQAAGRPCRELERPAPDRVRVYASSGASHGPAQLADLAAAVVAAGFPALKVRIGRDWRAGIAGLEAVRSAVGDALDLLVDCNQAWRLPWDTEAAWDLDQALEVARELEPLGVAWMEEPLERADRAGMQALRQNTRVRIAGGEMAREFHDLRDLVVEGCLDVVQPDAALSGGPVGSIAIAALAHAHDVAFTPHTWGDGIGLMANAQLHAATGGDLYLEYPYDPPTWTPARRDFVLAEPIVAAGGWLSLPSAPGLGITLDTDRLAAIRL